MGVDLGGASPLGKQVSAIQAKGKGGKATTRLEEAPKRSSGPTDRNPMRGRASRGERAKDREAPEAKGSCGRSGGRAAKVSVLTRGDPASRLKGRRAHARRRKSAEAVVARNRSRTGGDSPDHPEDFGPREGPNEAESESIMSLRRKSPQMPGQPGRAERGEGEARAPASREEDRKATNEHERSGTDALMEAVVQRDNLLKALKRVKANKGGPGVDGMTVDQLSAHLRVHWPRLREELLAGRYQPQPVRRHEIPKATGGTRTLGIPTVVDRFIQQAILQVLQPRFEPTFSPHSYGFRPGRSAHGAIAAAQRYVSAGRVVVVDVERGEEGVLRSLHGRRVGCRPRLVDHYLGRHFGFLGRILGRLRRLHASFVLRQGALKGHGARALFGAFVFPCLHGVQPQLVATGAGFVLLDAALAQGAALFVARVGARGDAVVLVAAVGAVAVLVVYGLKGYLARAIETHKLAALGDIQRRHWRSGNVSLNKPQHVPRNVRVGATPRGGGLAADTPTRATTNIIIIVIIIDTTTKAVRKIILRAILHI